MNEQKIMTWYSYSLTERNRKEIVGKVPRALEYGLTRVWGLLPEQAKQLVRDAYAAEVAK